MAVEQANGFTDNWAYLRTELYWLERLLIAAVAKQQKEAKDIDRVARSKADRATSHWWKGIITSEGTVAYDEYREPASKTTHNQQIDTQIKATQQRGVILALPTLRDRLGLSLFEKNVVLMSLAPEVNRRYAQLYRYLQGEDSNSKADLPTLDLVLRLLCKSDQDWRTSRNYLISKSRLTRYHLLKFLPCAEETQLNSPLKLTEPLVNYLLADQPTAQALDDLLKTCVTPEPTVSEPIATAPIQIKKAARTSSLVFLRRASSAKQWSDLVLPQSVLTTLTGIEQKIQGYLKAQQKWQLASDLYQPGSLILLTGATELSKTLAAGALAASLKTSLWQVDLAAIDPVDYANLLQEIHDLSPTLLLFQSAELWLKRSSLLSASSLRQFWIERRQKPSVTFFSINQPAVMASTWQSQFDHQLDFPSLDATDRWLLWQKAFPAQVPLETTINWKDLAEQLPLNEAEIRSIVQESIAYAAVADAEQVGLDHILQALAQRNLSVQVKQLEVKPTKRRSKKKTV